MMSILGLVFPNGLLAWSFSALEVHLVSLKVNFFVLRDTVSD